MDICERCSVGIRGCRKHGGMKLRAVYFQYQELQSWRSRNSLQNDKHALSKNVYCINASSAHGNPYRKLGIFEYFFYQEKYVKKKKVPQGRHAGRPQEFVSRKSVSHTDERWRRIDERWQTFKKHLPFVVE